MAEDKQNTPTGIRIYLDLAGLERLIGGNTAAEIEIREGIVRTFARKHLKEIAALKAFQPYLEKISEAVTAELKAQVPLILVEKSNGWSGRPERYKLDDSDTLVAKFKEQLKEEGREILQPMCDEAFNGVRGYITRRFDEAITELKARAEEVVTKHMNKAFEQLVKVEVDRRLKEIAKNLAKGEG